MCIWLLVMVLLLAGSPAMATSTTAPRSDSGADVDNKQQPPGSTDSLPAKSPTGIVAKSLITGKSGDFNITAIVLQLENSTEDEIRQLCEALGVQTKEQIYTQFLNIKPDEIDAILLDKARMHVRTYEKGLMQYDAYRAHKILLLYVPPFIIVIGTFGNVFTFIILRSYSKHWKSRLQSPRKAMLKFSTYYYLMVLAVADTLVLYVGLLRLWVGELTGYDLRDQSNWLCKVTTMLGYTTSDFSVWLIIAVTIERYIVVCHPLKASSICSTQRAKKFILLLLLCFFALNCHFFFTMELAKSKVSTTDIYHMCASREQYSTLVDEVWPWVDAAMYSFLPFAAITFLNVLIIRQVMRAHRRRNTLQSSTGRSITTAKTPMNLNQRDCGGDHYEHRRPSHEGSTRLTVMLLTISFAFLFTTLPANAINIVIAFIDKDVTIAMTIRIKLVKTITELLMYTNHSINFFLYCATGQKFRHQLIWMLCYSKRRKYAQQHRAYLQNQLNMQQTTTWQSELSQATTRADNTRIGETGRLGVPSRPLKTGDSRHSTDHLPTIKNDMYTPLKHSTSA